MTRPRDEHEQNAANWWNSKDSEDLERLEFLQKEMMAAMNKPNPSAKNDDDMMDDEEDMGPPDLPEDEDDMGPPDLPEDDEMALEPTDREMDMQDRMAMRRQSATRRPAVRSRANSRMMSGEPRKPMTKALRAEMELKRAFSPDKRRDLAKSGMALPDGSFPIVTEEDLKNAIAAFGRAKSKAAAKRHIMKRARALKRGDLIPDNWGKKDAKGAGYAMGMDDMSMPKPKKKKNIPYGEKMAEMEDDEMTSPMSREELMDRVFKKKKKKPVMDDESEMDSGDETE